MRTNQAITRILIQKENYANPFLRNFYYRISFKTWRRVSKYRLNIKAVTMLEKSGHMNIVDKTSFKCHKTKMTNIEIADENYFSTTSDEDKDETLKIKP